MPINLRKDQNRPRSPLAIPTAPSRDQSPPIDKLFTGSQPSTIRTLNIDVLFFLFAGTLLVVTPFTGIDTIIILLGRLECGRGSAAEMVLGRGGYRYSLSFVCGQYASIIIGI